MKSILVHINPDEGQEARLQAALDVVRYFEGHLTCLQVSPLETFAAIDPYGVSQLLSETAERVREFATEQQKTIEERLRNEGIGWEWHSHLGDAARLLGDHSWLSDLVVVSSPGKNWKPRFEAPPAAADVAVRSRAPVLVVPDESRGFDCTGPMAIAWNGSPESCVAVRAALPMLHQASAVHVLTVAEADGFDFPSVEASAYLSRQGIESELHELEHGSAPISDLLLDAAKAQQAVCLVMGAFGHSRLRENIFGGVTRGMLQRATLPLLLSH